MKTYREKRQVRNFMYSPLMLLILAIIVLFFARSVWGAYTKERASSLGKEEALAELEDLQVRKDKLEKELQGLNTAEGMERELRNKFQVAHPGESMITIVEPEEKKP